jgi:hypothetical protein
MNKNVPESNPYVMFPYTDENIYRMPYSIPALVQNNILDDSLTTLNDFVSERKSRDLKLISGLIYKLFETLGDNIEIAKNTNNFYIIRQSLAIRKNNISDDMTYFNALLSAQRKKEIMKIKAGTGSIKPSSEYEKKIWMDDSLLKLNACYDILKSHLDFLCDSMKNVADSTFHIQTFMELNDIMRAIK